MEKFNKDSDDMRIYARQRQLESAAPANSSSTPKVNFEPTPIGPSGVAAVSNLPLEHALLSSDLSQINFLQQLFRPAQIHHPQQAQQLQAYAARDSFSPFAFPPNLPSAANVAYVPQHQTSSPAAATGLTPEDDHGNNKIKYGPRHIEQWNIRFQELLEFQRKHGHCLVPMYDHHSPKLSNWVKRQRNQYRLKLEGKHSTLCDKRQKSLEDLGFVWDSHAACWEERYKELYQFWREYGHSKVPKSYKKNPSLSVWVKCQRRQFKLLRAGKPSYISEDRIRMLKALDFDFNPRKETFYSEQAKRCP